MTLAPRALHADVGMEEGGLQSFYEGSGWELGAEGGRRLGLCAQRLQHSLAEALFVSMKHLVQRQRRIPWC